MVVGVFLFTNQAEAQVRVNVNLNIGRPSWGLPGNYPGDYYYMPEIDTYYDIPQRQFIYFDGRGWVYASELPYMYSDYDLYNGYKVVINEPRPYLHADIYRQRYNRYYNTYHPRVIIGSRQNYPGYPVYNRHDNGRHEDEDEDDRYENGRYNNNDRFNRGRENQHFDNKRNENDHNQRFDNRGDVFGNYGYSKNGKGHGNGKGRWKSEKDDD